jgi:hypothetical protein
MDQRRSQGMDHKPDQPAQGEKVPRNDWAKFV